MWRAIAVVNPKGGVGKTTTAVNLGACLALAGERVLVVDLDEQANATSHLGGEEDGTARVLRGEATIAQALQQMLPEGLALLGGGKTLGGLNANDASRGAFREGIRDFDRVIIDCPPSLGRRVRSALEWSDAVLIPVECGYFAMEGLAQVLREIEQFRRICNPGLDFLGILLTQRRTGDPLAAEIARDVRRASPVSVLRTEIPHDERLMAAASHGSSCIERYATAVGTMSYVALAREVRVHGQTPQAG